jgi:hypothetical protein
MDDSGLKGNVETVWDESGYVRADLESFTPTDQRHRDRTNRGSSDLMHPSHGCVFATETTA